MLAIAQLAMRSRWTAIGLAIFFSSIPFLKSPLYLCVVLLLEASLLFSNPCVLKAVDESTQRLGSQLSRPTIGAFKNRNLK